MDEAGDEAGFADGIEDAAGGRGQAGVAGEWQDGDLDGGEFGVELEQGAGFGLAGGGGDFFFGVGVNEEGHDGAVNAGGGFDDVWGYMLAAFLVEVGEVLAAGVGVGLEVEVGSVGDALDFAPAPGVEVFEVVGCLGVVGEFVGAVPPDADAVGVDAEAGVPVHAVFNPAVVGFFVLAGHDEVFDFHRLELAGSEDEVAGGDFVSERLAYLGDAEGEALSGGGEDVVEVDEDALGGFGSEIDEGVEVVFLDLE